MLRMLTFAASVLVLKTAMELWLAESLSARPVAPFLGLRRR